MDQETAPAEASPKVEGNAAQIGSLIAGIPVTSAIYVVGLVAFGWWMFGPSIHLTSNKLEKSLDLGKSTVSDFQTFKDSGGLDNKTDSKWHGYTVTSARTDYDAGGKLSGYILELNKNDYSGKLASFENVKSSMSGICGTNWISDGEMHKVDNGKITCSYLDQQSGTIEIIVSKR